MAIPQELIGDMAVLVPQQRVDSANAKQFEVDLLDAIKAGNKTILLDFKDLDYISSAGLRAILVAAKSAKAAGRRFLLCSMKENIREVFTVSGFAKILSIHPDRTTAAAAAAA